MNFLHTVLCFSLSRYFLLPKAKANMCFNETTKESWCCDNYILVDDICTECKIGTYSYSGMKNCEPCKANEHGPKCAFKCDCNDKSWCNPVSGCIPITTVDKPETTSTQKGDTVTVFDKTVTNSKPKEIKQSNATAASPSLYIYMGCAAGVISILVLVHILRNSLRGNQENRTKVSVDDDEHSEHDSVQPDTDLDHYLYVEIDDTRI